MKFVRLAVLLATFCLTSFAADLSGRWKVKSTWPNGPALKTAGEVILDLKIDGTAVTGRAHIGSWPGDGPITNGSFDGRLLIFDATGHLNSSTGIPTCHFEATVADDEMVLRMTMVKNASAPGTTFEFRGKKQSD